MAIYKNRLGEAILIDSQSICDGKYTKISYVSFMSTEMSTLCASTAIVGKWPWTDTIGATILTSKPKFEYN